MKSIVVTATVLVLDFGLETDILSIMQEPPMAEKMRTLGNDVVFKGAKAFAEENVVEVAMFKRAIERGDITIQR